MSNPEEAPVVAKLVFAEYPCLCVKYHSPIPLEVERHHLHPQHLQRQKHGKVIDHETVNLCGAAHSNIHIALRKRLADEPYRLWNRYQENIVNEGLRRIRGES